MTIAIGAWGPQAGTAIISGLRAAEAVATGAIGGFAVLVVLTLEGELVWYETQRGGSRTLFIDGETTGVEPPDPVQRAIAAALISSGPDRPVPLSQFLAAHPQAGLVTGHRVPQGPTVEGRRLNQAVLDNLMQGASAQQATERVLQQNPQADVGLITVARSGQLYVQNAPRVARRPDVGQAYLTTEAPQAAVGVLHNAMKPYQTLAPLVAEVTLNRMVPDPPLIGWITLSAGIPVMTGDRDRVLVDGEGQATHLVTTDPSWTVGERSGVALYLHSLVCQGEQVLGKTQVEPLCLAQDGVILSFSGQKTLRLGYIAS